MLDDGSLVQIPDDVWGRFGIKYEDKAVIE
jgi:hypothetical protein